MVPIIDPNITEDQAGFKPGRSCTGQLLNTLKMDSKKGWQLELFLDLYAVYDTVQHHIMPWKLNWMTGDVKLSAVIRSLVKDRRFFVDLDKSKSHLKRQKNGLPQGSVLTTLMFNVYTNYQPEPLGTQRFIHADDLGLIS